MWLHVRINRMYQFLNVWHQLFENSMHNSVSVLLIYIIYMGSDVLKYLLEFFFHFILLLFLHEKNDLIGFCSLP